MNKTELIAAVAEKSGLSKKDSEAAVVATIAAITDALKADDKVQIVGFGSFEVKKKAAHMGRNLSLIHICREEGWLCPSASKTSWRAPPF